MSYPSWKDMTLVMLDQVLGQTFAKPLDKVKDLREIERAAKRMADGIERRWTETMAEHERLGGDAEIGAGRLNKP